MISSSGESLPRLVYLENLSQALGKPTIAVNNPTNEHVSHSQLGVSDLINYEYFARYTLSAFAAAPSGMSRHWYGKNYDEDTLHMDLYAKCNPFLGRLGGPVSQAAMVFSYRGALRAMPRPWLETWKSYYALQESLLFEHKIPCLTLFADTLKESLERHPEITTLILTPYFPISEEETQFIESWLEEKPGRNLIYIGGDVGYTYDLGISLYTGDKRQGPEMLSLFGIDPKSVKPVRRDDRVHLKFVGSDTDKMKELSGTPTPVVKTSGTASVEFTSEDVEVLYVEETSGRPVIARRRIGDGSSAHYVGLSIDGIEAGKSSSDGCVPFPLLEVLSASISAEMPPVVLNADPGILWSRTCTGYIVISNTWESQGRASLKPVEGCYWDCRSEEHVDGNEVSIPPLDFSVLRIVPNGSPFLDMLNVLAVEEFDESPDRLRISGLFGKQFCVISASPPEKVVLNGTEVDWEIESVEAGWGVIPELGDEREGLIEIYWSQA